MGWGIHQGPFLWKATVNGVLGLMVCTAGLLVASGMVLRRMYLIKSRKTYKREEDYAVLQVRCGRLNHLYGYQICANLSHIAPTMNYPSFMMVVHFAIACIDLYKVFTNWRMGRDWNTLYTPEELEDRQKLLFYYKIRVVYCLTAFACLVAYVVMLFFESVEIAKKQSN